MNILKVLLLVFSKHRCPNILHIQSMIEGLLIKVEPKLIASNSNKKHKTLKLFENIQLCQETSLTIWNPILQIIKRIDAVFGDLEFMLLNNDNTNCKTEFSRAITVLTSESDNLKKIYADFVKFLDYYRGSIIKASFGLLIPDYSPNTIHLRMRDLENLNMERSSLENDLEKLTTSHQLSLAEIEEKLTQTEQEINLTKAIVDETLAENVMFQELLDNTNEKIENLQKTYGYITQEHNDQIIKTSQETKLQAMKIEELFLDDQKNIRNKSLEELEELNTTLHFLQNEQASFQKPQEPKGDKNENLSLLGSNLEFQDLVASLESISKEKRKNWLSQELLDSEMIELYKRSLEDEFREKETNQLSRLSHQVQQIKKDIDFLKTLKQNYYEKIKKTTWKRFK